ncbi:PREDICTED: uncharacterized protein LOC108746506 [Trachymyrmex septentrionalis]|uniref:uncharacterized protein LOC108746506 n=1 Tax=Trachymyrmex septentrionalis TaxID=34720 RepID=UPI00084F34B5|nr:PREDICTED: uncharacterized protein LOC108746506 [Trachymyrmex septentrionalis]
MGRHLRASSFKSLYCEMLLSITVPYHSASNEAAENAVRTFKKKFKVLFKDNMKHDALCKYLFYYRSTPHCTTEKTPAELHLNRRLRTRLDIRSRVEQKQSDEQRFFRGNRAVIFGINDSVMAKDYRIKSWRQATIVEQTSPVTYDVKTDDGCIWRRHIDQLRICNLRSSVSSTIKSWNY